MKHRTAAAAWKARRDHRLSRQPAGEMRGGDDGRNCPSLLSCFLTRGMNEMGTHRADGGYSATVRAYLELHGERLPVAKTGGGRLSLCDRERVLPVGTRGVLVIEVDDARDVNEVVIGETVDGQTKYLRVGENKT